jgi:hypothetical protein
VLDHTLLRKGGDAWDGAATKRNSAAQETEGMWFKNLAAKKKIKNLEATRYEESIDDSGYPFTAPFRLGNDPGF